jgi:RNA polymerase sigma-70 factor (ECF subfamily)
MREGNRPTPAIQEPETGDGLDLQALVERAGQGDADAFRALFERYAGRVHRYALARVGRGEDAQDVLQEVFLAAWRGLPTFRQQHAGSFPGWLFAIARNVVADSARSAIRSRWVPLESVPESAVEFEGRLLSQRVLADGLRRLPEMQREVLILRFVVGLSAREAGAALGKTEGAVESLQVRALEQLRNTIGRGE